jgi:hypothetical protein
VNDQIERSKEGFLVGKNLRVSSTCCAALGTRAPAGTVRQPAAMEGKQLESRVNRPDYHGVRRAIYECNTRATHSALPEKFKK